LQELLRKELNPNNFEIKIMVLDDRVAGQGFQFSNETMIAQFVEISNVNGREPQKIQDYTKF
jgi:hypothetical protein